MSTRAVVIQLGIWCAALAVAPPPATAQVPSGPKNSSCRQFAQSFYDWYVPVWQKTTKEPSSNVALQRKAAVFEPELLRALKIDAEAQSRAKGEIVGLDFDPFLGSQDPADRYEIREATLQGDKCLVEIWEASRDSKLAKPEKPAVVAELRLDKGRWQFLNFHYPEVNADLVSVLEQLRKDRGKQ
jgi:hypothetical protein